MIKWIYLGDGGAQTTYEYRKTLRETKRPAGREMVMLLERVLKGRIVEAKMKMATKKRPVHIVPGKESSRIYNAGSKEEE